MPFIVEPLRGISIVRPMQEVKRIEFGMTAEMTRPLMNTHFTSGDIRAKSKEHPTDHFENDGAFFYYDDEGYLEGVEFTSGADIRLGEVNPFNLTAGQAIALLKQLDPDLIVDGDGATSLKFSLAIWCPELVEGEDAPVETFVVARSGLYDEIYAA